jgi:MFS family permease
MSHDDSYAANHPESPLPTKQLAVLAVMALCEQTALNSIGPYLPTMVSTFPDVDDPDRVGLYVGIIVSTFALAQFITSFFWAWLSDRIGRKPVIIVGTVLTAVGFLAFGFCRALWQAILIQAFIGLVNGNQGIVSACLGEITNRSNQSKVFTYLPMIYGIGGITGPVLGGLLGSSQDSGPYPFLVPNLVCAAILTIDFIIITIFLDESLEEARDLPHLGQRAGSLFAWIFQFISAKRPTYLKRQKLAQVNGDAARGAASDSDTDSDIVSDSSHSSSSNHMPSLIPENTTGFTSKDILNRDSIIFLSTYLIFQLSNVSFGALYTIFGQANPPTGRGLSPKEIGLSLGYAGGVAILSQMGIFGPLREKMGNVATYRTGLAGFVLVFFLMPFVGYKDNGDGGGQATSTGKAWLWIELGFALLVKTVAATGGLTSALLLVSCVWRLPRVIRLTKP